MFLAFVENTCLPMKSHFARVVNTCFFSFTFYGDWQQLLLTMVHDR